MNIYNFENSVEAGEGYTSQISLYSVYLQLFPYRTNMRWFRYEDNRREQREGKDLIITNNGKDIVIEEKYRQTSFDDFLIEEYSVLEKGVKGWTVDPKKKTHLLMYVIEKLNKCYPIPYKILRRVVIENLEDWKINNRPIDVQTNYQGRIYTTRNWAVSWEILNNAIMQYKNEYNIISDFEHLFPINPYMIYEIYDT